MGGKKLSPSASEPLTATGTAVFSVPQGPTSRADVSREETGALDPFVNVDDELAEEEGLGLLARDISVWNRNLLIEALRQPGVPGVAAAAENLRILIAENKACDDSEPVNARIYMGLDGVRGLDGQPIDLDNGTQTAALAKHLRRAANVLWDRLEDPACKQMLDWICNYWQRYEKASYGSFGPRLSIYRASTEPRVAIRPDSEWGKKAARAHVALHRNPPLIIRRDVERCDLNMALFACDDATVTSILQEIPGHFDQLDHYFVPASIHQINACNALHKLAQAYNQKTQSTASRRLVQFMGVNLLRAHAFARMESDLKRFSPEDLDACFPPKVRALCVAMRDTLSAELRSQARRFRVLIQAALATPNLDTEFSQQPFASLRLMLLKCKVLELFVEKTLMDRLREHIELARQDQMNVSALLRGNILEDHPDEETIGALARVEYAKQMTSLPIDYVSAGATLEQVDVMHAHLLATGTSITRKGREYLAQKVAIVWVAQQIEKTQSQAH